MISGAPIPSWVRPAITKPGIQLEPAVRHILTYGLTSAAKTKDEVDQALKSKLIFTTDHHEIIGVLRSHEWVSQQNLTYALAAQPLKIPTLRMNRKERGEVL